MNSKTNRTFFIIIALLGSVKDSYAPSNQLAIKSPHARLNTIKGVKTFESSNPFAVLRKMNDESDGSGSLSDAYSVSPRPFHENRRKKKRSRLNSAAGKTPITKTNGSRLGMPSVEGIVLKGLPYFVTALGFLNGAQGASSEADCSEDTMQWSCSEKGWDKCFDQKAYNKGGFASFGYSALMSFACAGSIALVMVGYCLFYRHQLKKIRSKNTEKGFLLGSVQNH